MSPAFDPRASNLLKEYLVAIERMRQSLMGAIAVKLGRQNEPETNNLTQFNKTL
jgi:hypothetical protein